MSQTIVGVVRRNRREIAIDRKSERKKLPLDSWPSTAGGGGASVEPTWGAEKHPASLHRYPDRHFHISGGAGLEGLLGRMGFGAHSEPVSKREINLAFEGKTVRIARAER